MRSRLAVMMVLQYAVMGAWAVTLPTFLMGRHINGGLDFSGQQVAAIYITSAIAALVTPFIVGVLADRWVANQRLLAGLHLLSFFCLGAAFYQAQVECSAGRKALLAFFVDRERPRDKLESFLQQADFKRKGQLPDMLWSARIEILKQVDEKQAQLEANQRDFERLKALIVMHDTSGPITFDPRMVAFEASELLSQAEDSPLYHVTVHSAANRLFVIFLLNSLCYMPTISLSNSIALRNLHIPHQQYGSVRVFGTIGWMLAGIGVGLFIPAVSPFPLLLGAALSLLLGIYSFTLPNTPPAHEGKTLGQLFGVPAIKMFAHRDFRIFALTSVIITLLASWHNIYLNRYLADLGVAHAAAWQSTGQVCEIFCILALPWVTRRLGLKRTLLLGIVGSVARYGFYAAGNVPWLLAVGIPLQGVCFTYYFIAATLFVDRSAPRDLRASAQGLMALLTSGIGAFAGNWLSGLCVDHYRTPANIDWPTVWLIPAAGSVVIAAVFLWRFREPTMK